MDFGMICQVGFCQFAMMGARTNPNQDEGSANAATKMLQALDRFFGVDQTFKTLLEDPSTHEYKSNNLGGHAKSPKPPFEKRRSSRISFGNSNLISSVK